MITPEQFAWLKLQQRAPKALTPVSEESCKSPLAPIQSDRFDHGAVSGLPLISLSLPAVSEAKLLHGYIKLWHK